MITSSQNPLVKQMRKLQRAKARQEQNLFLLEGTHLLQEACAVGHALETVCYTPDWQAAHPELDQQLGQLAQRVEIVSLEVVQAIATTVNPDGIVATARRDVRSLAPLAVQAIQVGVALERLQDPGNLGAIIRTAAAVGAEGLWLSADSVELDNPKVLRASAGQWFRLPMQTSSDLKADLQTLQRQGVQVIATSPTASLTYWQADFTQPSVVLLGNEGAGLSSDLLDLADCTVQIPLTPAVESLNVSIAAALILYEMRRQQRWTPVA
ncbi:MAG: TrmH family RNA methyltransferase [Elainella sp.]